MRKGTLIGRVAAAAVALTAVLGAAPASTAATSDTPPAGENCWATHYGYIPPAPTPPAASSSTTTRTPRRPL